VSVGGSCLINPKNLSKGTKREKTPCAELRRDITGEVVGKVEIGKKIEVTGGPSNPHHKGRPSHNGPHGGEETKAKKKKKKTVFPYQK